jgi:rhodanese-related sulfurtransferase
MVATSPVTELPDSVVLLDVREDDEWAAGHAQHAVHIPIWEVTRRLDDVAAAFPDRLVHVVCRTGLRSAQIASYLKGLGLTAVDVEGGMQAWAAAGRPLVAETDQPPTVL